MAGAKPGPGRAEPYHGKSPPAVAVDGRPVGAKDGNLETPGHEGEEDLQAVQAKLKDGDAFGVRVQDIAEGHGGDGGKKRESFVRRGASGS